MVLQDCEECIAAYDSIEFLIAVEGLSELLQEHGPVFHLKDLTS